MGTQAKIRASNLREFKDYDDEVRETGSREAEHRRFEAMRSKDVRDSDFVHAQERLTGRNVDAKQARLDLLRKLKFNGWKEK